MNMKTLIAFLVIAFVPGFAAAQDYGEDKPEQAPLADGSPTQQADDQEPKRAGDYRIRVTVRGPDGAPLADKPVFLRAARPRGPFEPTAPEPVREWTGFSNADGVALFDITPKGLDGLRVHAVTTHDGQPFESAAVTPGDGTKLTIRAHERTLDPSVVKIKSLRTVVQPWEEYLVFTQFYQLQNSSDLALDIAAIPDPDYERGIPLTLPVKAQGIQAMGPGENAVVDSTVYWKGFMKPGEVVNIQVRYSMSAREPSFVFEQTMEYDADEVEVVVPLQTDFEKLPRLDTVALLAPGFEELGRTQDGKSPLDLRRDMEFLAAWGNPVKKGESFTFKLEGLPFEKPILPWVFLIAGIVMALGIVVYARKETARMGSKQGVKDLKLAFQAERSELLTQLEELERQQRSGMRTQPEYESMKLSLREQLALILKKLHDLEDDA
jgi:hypothetical protein